jgi:hypothetical protein
MASQKHCLDLQYNEDNQETTIWQTEFSSASANRLVSSMRGSISEGVQYIPGFGLDNHDKALPLEVDDWCAVKLIA